MSFEYPNQQPIIDHVPTQAQLETANQLNADHNTYHALSLDNVGKLLAGMGLEQPDTPSPVSQPPIRAEQAQAGIPVIPENTHPEEPDIPPVFPKELKALLRQLAEEDSRASE